MGVFDVPAGRLIEQVAAELKGKIKKPEFTEYVKTGAHRERAPYNPDWFYVRSASILYRLYRQGALGTGALRNYYGGRKNRGVRPERKRKASGKIIRTALQLLEKEGLVRKEKKGRSASAKGEKLLYAKAKELEKIVAEEVKKAAEKKAEDNAKRDEARKKNEAQAKAAEALKQQQAEKKAGNKGAEKFAQKGQAGKAPAIEPAAEGGAQGKHAEVKPGEEGHRHESHGQKNEVKGGEVKHERREQHGGSKAEKA